jgi:hypothetical protein
MMFLMRDFQEKSEKKIISLNMAKKVVMHLTLNLKVKQLYMFQERSLLFQASKFLMLCKDIFALDTK